MNSQPWAVNTKAQTGAKLLMAAIAWYLAYTILQPGTEFLAFDVLPFARGSHLGESVAFFLYGERCLIRFFPLTERNTDKSRKEKMSVFSSVSGKNRSFFGEIELRKVLCTVCRKSCFRSVR